MSRHEDIDGIDGPFNRAMDRAMKDDAKRLVHTCRIAKDCDAEVKRLRARVKNAEWVVAELEAVLYGLAAGVCDNFPETCASKGIAREDLTCDRCWILLRLREISQQTDLIAVEATAS